MPTGAAITGTGVWAPEAIITNEELCDSFNAYVGLFNDRNAAAIATGEIEALGESNADFIFKASGIRRRHVSDKDGILDPNRMCPNLAERPMDQPSITAEWALNATEKALKVAGRKSSDIDMVMFSTASIQRQYPAMGMEVQHLLGASGFAFDANVACSSATYGIQTAVDAVRAGNAKCALVVGPELMSAQTNWRDRDSHFIFGDATTAVIVEPTENVQSGGAFEVLGTRLSSHYSTNIRNNFGITNRCDPNTQFDADKLFHQQGRRVFKDVVPLASKFISSFIQDSGFAPRDLKRYWLHQANIKMNTLIAKRVVGEELSADAAPIVIDEYANTASAGSIIAFDEHHADLVAGDLGLICSFGAGYSIGGILVKRMPA